MCTCKGKNKKPANNQWKEKIQRTYERGIKHISMVDMTSKETRKQANKQEDKQAKRQIKGGVHGGQM